MKKLFRSYQYFNEKKYKEAIADLKKLAELSKDLPSKSGFYNNIAMCYAELKDNDQTEKYFSEAVKIDKNNVNALNGLVTLYLKNNEVIKAMSSLSRIIEINPGDMKAKNTLDSLIKIK